MEHALFFLPDISGFTKFVQTTEVEHSQHVVAELLEVLIDANEIGLTLAEIEGDALFFYKEGVPSKEELIKQMRKMFEAFHGHLKMMETHRICPCNACRTAPKLELKIVAHCGPISYIKVKNSRKPFGQQVIEAHRLLKNSIDSDNYALISSELANGLKISEGTYDQVFDFSTGADQYDDQEVAYLYSAVDIDKLEIGQVANLEKLGLPAEPQLVFNEIFNTNAAQFLEYVSNFRYRSEWVDGIDKFVYDENEVTRNGSEHICVINGKELDFVTLTKEAEPHQLIYGEVTESPPPVDALYQFFTIDPIDEFTCQVSVEVYWKAKSPFKKLFMSLAGKRFFEKNISKNIAKLKSFVNAQVAVPA